MILYFIFYNSLKNMHISKRIGENTISSSSSSSSNNNNNNNNNNNTRDLKKLAIIHIKKLDKINAFKKQKNYIIKEIKV